MASGSSRSKSGSQTPSRPGQRPRRVRRPAAHPKSGAGASSASASARWRRRKHARPSEIAAAALEVFAERGFSAARLEDVAARAGVSKGTVYLYFASKEELLKSVVRESLLPNLAEAERMAQGFSGTTPELLARLLTRIGGVIAGTKIGAIPKIIISESGNFPELARFYLREVIHRGFRLFGAVLERGVARGEFRAVDVPNALRVLASAMLFLAVWKHAMEPNDTQRLDTDAYLRAYVDVVLRGIAAEKA